MRQRIKAVETIKKITHAMRLISMSAHSRLRHKKVHLENYKNAFQTLWARVSNAAVTPTYHETTYNPAHHLIILVSSQKGLCGTFNSSLFRFFEQELPHEEDTQYIAVGKYASDYLTQHKKIILASYTPFSYANFVTIAQAITAIILQSPEFYSSVAVFSNFQKSFFIQRPRKTIIYPMPEMAKPAEDLEPPINYIFEQSPQELGATIRQLMLTVSLEESFFDSLLAEQAARFISMDASTRNADKLLITMKLEYNKRRQAAITAELTELATSII